MTYLNNVTTLKLDQSKCINCLRCTEVCPHHVFNKLESKVEIMDKNRCIECGACRMNCPVAAIAVDAGVGCASAIILNKLSKIKLLKLFIKKDCC